MEYSALVEKARTMRRNHDEVQPDDMAKFLKELSRAEKKFESDKQKMKEVKDQIKELHKVVNLYKKNVAQQSSVDDYFYSLICSYNEEVKKLNIARNSIRIVKKTLFI